jgi:hypothetical protein
MSALTTHLFFPHTSRFCPPMPLIEAIAEMPDFALFRACIEAEPGPFQDAARAELTGNRCYDEGDLEREIDRFLELRAAEGREAVREYGECFGIMLAL